MRSIPVNLATHLAGDATALVACWMLTRKDGTVLRYTEAAADIVIATSTPMAGLVGTYLSTGGISGSEVHSSNQLEVDSMDVSGPLSNGLLQSGPLNAADIEAGIYDDAPVVVFMVNQNAPNDGQIILRTGNIGNIQRASIGQFKAELRGLTQRLSQTIVETTSITCRAELGDARCKFNIVPVTRTGTVTAVSTRRVLFATVTGADAAGTFTGGLLKFTSGNNNGFSREVKKDAGSGVGGLLEVFEAFPRDIAVGNTFTITPGCDKTAFTCRTRFANLVNFRGEPFIPGIDYMTKGPIP